VFARACFLDRGEGVVCVLMTAARTIPQLRNGVEDFWAIHFFVGIRLECGGMASGTVRLVGAEFPGDNLVICVMAGCTDHARVVGLIEGRGMGVILGRCPGRGRVAAVT